MFKLAELFVELKANEAPFTAALEKLKGRLPAIGSALSGAFSAITGPVGIAFTAVKSLFDLIPEGNKDVEELGSYWTEATEPIKNQITGVATKLAEWGNQLVKLVKESEFVKNAMTAAAEYAEAGIENVKIAIDRGIEVYEQLKDAAVETWTGITILAGEYYDAFMKAFGGTATASVTSWGATIQSSVVDMLTTAGVIVRNWPEFFEIAKLSIQEKFINLGEYIAVLPQNLGIIGNYVANNWRALVVDGVNAVSTAFQNLATNLGELGYAIYSFLTNPTGGFNFEWKPLLDGFKATAEKMPDLLKPHLTSMQDEISKVQDRIAAREAAGFAKHPAKKAEAETAAAAEEAAGGKFKSVITGSAEFYAKLRQGIFSDSDDKPTRTMKAAERTATATEDAAAALKNPPAAKMV